jgi:hypothetical protein
VRSLSGLPSDSPLMLRYTWLMYLGACAVCEIARPFGAPDIWAPSCGTARAAFPLSLFVLAGASSSFSTRWSSLRPMSQSLLAVPDQSTTPVDRCCSIRLHCPWPGYAQRHATHSQPYGPKGDHHVRKPRSRKILTTVYE